MYTAPTNAERIKRLPWWFAAGMLDNVRVSLIFGSVFVLFLDALGMGRAKIGILVAMPLFFQVFSVFAVPLVEKIGYKKSCLIFFSVRTLSLLGLLLTPFFAEKFGQSGTFWWVAAVMFVFSVALITGLTASGPWGMEVLPTNIRSKIIALNTFLCGLVIICGTWFAGFWLERHSGVGGFMFLVAAGSIIGFGAIISHMFFPGGKKRDCQKHFGKHLADMFGAIQDKNFAKLLAGICLFIFIIQGLVSFIPLYMKDLVGIDNSKVVYLGIWQNAGVLFAVYFWGWCTDRFGGKPVFITGIMFHTFLPVMWYLIPRGNGNLTYYSAAAVSFLTGLMCVAYVVGIDRYVFLTAIPENKKTSYYAVWFALTGLFAGLGPLAVGLMLKWFAPLDNVGTVLSFIRIDSFVPIFAMHMILPAIGMYIFRAIKTDSEITTSQFVGQLFQSVPFGLFGSLNSIIRYRMAGEEVQRIATTRNLGRKDSPFNTEELIEALNDPSFDVRYEAVVAIAARKANPKIVAALLEVLCGEDIELSATAAWALGQIGDASAIEPLRQMLTAPYLILRARSARALGMLGDKESANLIFELMKIETDPVLRVAYCSALGALNFLPAIDQVLATLFVVHSATHRGEVAVAAARLIGNEKNYIKLLRLSNADMAVALSSAVLKLAKPMSRLKLDEAIIESISACAANFAAEQYAMAVTLLGGIIEAVPKSDTDVEFRKIFVECVKALIQFGNQRTEYILLAVHTFDTWLKAKCTLKNNK